MEWIKLIGIVIIIIGFILNFIQSQLLLSQDLLLH